MVQGAVREAKTKHATAHTTTTEKQGNEDVRRIIAGFSRNKRRNPLQDK